MQETAPVPNAASGAASGSANGAQNGPAIIISGDVETSCSNSSGNRPQIRACYHINEDNIILMDDVLMAPYVFRTQDAVECGALAECVMTGMLRAHFSNTSKLKSVEMIYDAMGFMQQLERASGNEMTAQIIPGSLEMALSPNSQEARVITLAEKPYKIVNVNERWTKMTQYTQMEAEGKELFKLLEGDSEVDSSEDLTNLPYELDDAMQARCTCSTRLHLDKEGREFVDFVCSYPLTNAMDEITHILHVSKELPEESSVDMNEAVMAEVG
jgi:PAS domain-containing protein